MNMALFGRKKSAPEPGVELVAEAPVPQRTPDQQREHLIANLEPLRPFGMQINDVAGLTLCEDVASDIDLPMVTTSRVEGYGVRAANIVGATGRHPIDLRLVGAVEDKATVPNQALPAGGCVLISEGAPVPVGVDAVVALADAEQVGRTTVIFTDETRLNENLHLRGSELADGAELIAAGTLLDARSVAMLAEVGLDKVLVRPRLRIVVVTVDSSLVAPGEPLTAVNQRYDSVTAMVTAAARADGATVYPVGVLPSDASVLKQALTDQAIRADLMIVLAGPDAEERLVFDVLRGLGPVDRAEVSLNGLGIYSFARLGDDQVPVLVLPAGAVSAFVAYHVLVRPVMARLADADADGEARRQATARGGVRSIEGATQYVPAVVAGDEIRPVSQAGVEMAYDLYRANALMILAADRPDVEPGDRIDFLPLDGGQRLIQAGTGQTPR